MRFEFYLHGCSQCDVWLTSGLSHSPSRLSLKYDDRRESWGYGFRLGTLCSSLVVGCLGRKLTVVVVVETAAARGVAGAPLARQ